MSAALAAWLAFLLAERGFELALARRNAARVIARGAIEHGAAHYPAILAFHALWPAALLAEVALAGAVPPPWWPAALAALLVGQALRMAAMRALGERWNTRILVVPGEPPVASGLYRWIPHPNYVGVALEVTATPLLFGAWRTALAATAIHGVLLAVRIRAEDRALGRTPAARAAVTRAR